jgi:hypothetical protein
LPPLAHNVTSEMLSAVRARLADAVFHEFALPTSVLQPVMGRSFYETHSNRRYISSPK